MSYLRIPIYILVQRTVWKNAQNQGSMKKSIFSMKIDRINTENSKNECEK